MESNLTTRRHTVGAINLRRWYASATVVAERKVRTEMTEKSKKIEFGGVPCEMPHPILDSRKIGDRILILYDYMDYPRYKQARNLLAYDFDGNELWTAEHPTNTTADSYVSFHSTEPLWVWNFASYKCRIDTETGKLIEKVFTK